jgi:hypothetical protein
MFNKLFLSFSEFCKRLFQTPFKTECVEDLPDDIKKKTLYIIGTKEEPWQVELFCPCGCEDKIVLPTNDTMKPRWYLEVKKGKPSLSPSIFRSKGCKSHFFLREGYVDWCFD